MIDSVDTTIKAIGGGGLLQIDWTTFLFDNIIYYILGLVATFIYFWAIIRAGTVDQDTFKEFFSIKKNQNTFYLHLILYHAIIILWWLMGLYTSITLIGEPLKFIFSLINVDISTQIGGIYTWINDTFPKGQLSAITIVLGGGMTFIVRNLLPALWRWFKGFFKSKSGV